jgi:CMP-N,N'-diacetyllegionaminic acid synthase
MIGALNVLAVVPARSGSQGIIDKNMRAIGGKSLIAHAAATLRACTTVDRAMISTDSQKYCDEAKAHGLDAWFLRPAELSTATATAVDTVSHAVRESERHYGLRFEIVLIVEPTSPLREPADVDGAAQLLAHSGAQSVVTVTRADAKYHPRKLLRVAAERLQYYVPEGASVTARQQLDGELYFRNGACYALRRATLLESRTIFTERTLPYVIERPLVNIDDPFELELAEFLLARRARELDR